MNFELVYSMYIQKTRVLFTACTQQSRELIQAILLSNHFELTKEDELSSLFVLGDFSVLLDASHLVNQYQPHLVFLGSDAFIEEEMSLFNSMVAGGVLVYPRKNELLSTFLQTETKFFKKIEYDLPSVENYILLTDFGSFEVPKDEDYWRDLDGLKLFFQQIGIMEEDFYDAVFQFLQSLKYK